MASELPRAAWGGSASRDPIGYEDGWSVYSYVESSPTVHVDPSGKGAGLIPILGGAKAGVGGESVVPQALAVVWRWCRRWLWNLQDSGRWNRALAGASA